MDSSTYIDDFELTKYVWSNYHHLFLPLEQLIAKAVMVEDKAKSSTSLAMADLLREKWGAGINPEVVAALGDGTDVFQRRVRERVVRDCGDKLYINRCPACGRIVRTPRAKQCLWCSHSWHENNVVGAR